MARSSWFAIISSNHLRRIAERSFAVFARHAGNAAFARSIARLVSAAPMFGTVPTTAPLAGLSTLIVPPPSAAIHSPPMKQASRSSDESFRLSFETLSNMSHGLVDCATIVTPPLYMKACTIGSVPEHGWSQF